ncbi:hypothetical protein [Klebsiella pneumoniae]|uniref:hypothetical protein n=1 Tax=Klebsiella pneumoniae TaxID=573 RepID=UPI002739B785|nr:hypothetical protein [Klebsiella pneumoniae]
MREHESREPFAYIIQDKYERERGVEGHLSRSHVSKYVSQEDINEHEITCTPLYRHAQPATASEPLAVTDDELNAALQLHRLKVDGHSQLSDAFRAGFRYARRTTPQPAPVVPEEKPIPNTLSMYAVDAVAAIAEVKGWNACRAAMLQELKKSAGAEAICRSDENVQVLHTKSPVITDEGGLPS